MHLISRIEKRSSGRYQILLEGEDSFPLYVKELRQYGIEEGGMLEDQAYEEIMRELLPVRAKKKALYLLERMDRTEQQLYRKLTEGGYQGDFSLYLPGERYIGSPAYPDEKAVAAVKEVLA